MSSAAASKTWLVEYLSALTVRDAHEHALKAAYDDYSKLADRTASQTSTTHLEPSTESTHTTPPLVTSAKSRFSIPRASASPPPAENSNVVSSLRADLATAQSSKQQLTVQLTALAAENTTLQSTVASMNVRLRTLESSHAALTRKLRDREDELKRKKELLQGVQDDLLAAEMQVNVADSERQRVEAENRELVGRLVGAKELEVDKMNKMGGWG